MSDLKATFALAKSDAEKKVKALDSLKQDPRLSEDPSIALAAVMRRHDIVIGGDQDILIMSAFDQCNPVIFKGPGILGVTADCIHKEGD